MVRIVAVEREPVRRCGGEVFGRRVGDRVDQAACVVGDGYGPVAEAVQLIQSTRLVLAGHDKHICAGFDAMCQRVGELKSCGNAVRMFPGEVVQELMVLIFARAQNCPLDIAMADPALHNLADHIPTLLIGQATHESHERMVRLYRQPQFLL